MLLCLQGAEERKHRPGSGNGGKEDQKLADVLGGPGPDWEGRRGASQPDCEASSTPSLKVDCCSEAPLYFCLQDSAKKLEENVALFGSTVESLLYRYGKVSNGDDTLGVKP